MSIPTLPTTRLTLRPFHLEDATSVQRLAGVPEVALNTLNIPYPYEDGMAEEWIATHDPAWEARQLLALAIIEPAAGLVGAVGLQINALHRRGDIGYWIGLPYWNRGYATEAAAALIRYGFDELDLCRIQAFHLTGNPASGRVMEKLGMEREGVLRRHLVVRGKVEDVVVCAVLAPGVTKPTGTGQT